MTGVGAMDLANRRIALRVTAIISGLGALGPILQEVVIGRLYDLKGGDLKPVFALLFGSAVLGTLAIAALTYRARHGKGV